MDGGLVTCTYTLENGLVGYMEIAADDRDAIRVLGRGAVSRATRADGSRYSSYEPEPEPEPEPEELEYEERLARFGLKPVAELSPTSPPNRGGGQRDSLADAMARIEREGAEFREAALSYLVSGSTQQSEAGGGETPLARALAAAQTEQQQQQETPRQPRGRGGNTPRLARLAEQHTPRGRQRAPSLTDPLAEVRFSVGDEVWVYSTSSNKWIVGEVESVRARESSKGGGKRTTVRVMYWSGDAKRGKDIDADDRTLIRPLDPSLGRSVQRPRSPAE